MTRLRAAFSTPDRLVSCTPSPAPCQHPEQDDCRRSCCYFCRLATRAWVQQQPGGMGLPWGQVLGCPKKVQILSVASKERMCSNLHACCSTSASFSMCRVSMNSLSAKSFALEWKWLMEIPAVHRNFLE